MLNSPNAFHGVTPAVHATESTEPSRSYISLIVSGRVRSTGTSLLREARMTSCREANAATTAPPSRPLAPTTKTFTRVPLDATTTAIDEGSPEHRHTDACKPPGPTASPRPRRGVRGTTLRRPRQLRRRPISRSELRA